MEEWKLRLKQARESCGLNKTEFARLVKVSNATVTDWEKSAADGGIKEIAGPNLTKIARALDIDPHWLIDGGNREPEPVPSRPHVESPLADSFRLEIETAAELRLLSVYRLANSDGRAAIDAVVEQIRRRLDVDSVAGNKG